MLKKFGRSSLTGGSEAMTDRGALTSVERRAVKASPFAELYPPAERIKTIVVKNFPALGKLAAMRFVEWVQDHPGGVVSLPTGKTPEHFIRWVQRLTQNWDQAEVRNELELAGIDPGRKPDLRTLHFVQIDEFYPIEPRQDNSFYAYVNRFYVDGFGLDPAKASLINCTEIGLAAGQTLNEVWPSGEVDLSLRYRAARTALEQTQQDLLERIDQWCQEYEEHIRALGGIGFFLGGIGPDGHIGFNVRGSDHFSTTRLTEVNYETQAAAAADLGGIEVARKRLVITIGLGTITSNPDSCALIIAAGEAKAGIVAAAVEEAADIRHPASVLHRLPGARFYVTQGAAKLLKERERVLFAQQEEIADASVEKIVVDLAFRLGKRVIDLSEVDFAQDDFATELLQRRPEKIDALVGLVRDRLMNKIGRGTQTLSGTRFLHTEPHHDDLMLGYLPYIVRHVRDATNVHYFVCFTGGFTAVTNDFILAHLDRLKQFLKTAECAELLAEGYFDPGYEIGRNRDIWQATAQAGFEFSPGYSGFVRGVFNNRDFENLQTLGGLSQDSDGYNVAVGVSSEITNLISGEAYVGYLDQSYDSPAFKDVSGVSFGANLKWEATKLTSVTVTASREVADSTIPGTGGILYSIGGFGVSHELTPAISLKGDFAYYDANYEGIARDDSGYRASAGVDYTLSRMVHLDLTYNFDDRDSNVAGQSYTRNQVTLGVLLQY